MSGDYAKSPKMIAPTRMWRSRWHSAFKRFGLGLFAAFLLAIAHPSAIWGAIPIFGACWGFVRPREYIQRPSRFPIMAALLLVILAGAAFCAWVVYGGKTSNPHNYAAVGDIPTPRGYRRITGTDVPYATFLRALPLKSKGTRVQFFTGGDSLFQPIAYAVVDMPLLSNAEQCADVCMRLRAEYLFNARQYGRISFKDVNGHTLNYEGGASRKALESYLRKLYGVASTFSLSREMETRQLKDIQPGDVFVYPAGRYGLKMGHAIMVVDVAENAKGRKVFLLAEGNTPARNIHVMRNLLAPLYSPWFMLDDDADYLLLDGIPFKATDLKRF